MSWFLQAVALAREPYDLRQVFGDRAPRRFDRISELACVAAHQALAGAAWGDAPLFASTQLGNLSGTLGYLQRLHEKGARLANPAEFANLVISSLGANLSLQLKATGEVVTVNQMAPCHLLALHELSAAVTERGLWVGAEEGTEHHDAFAPGTQPGAVAVVVSRSSGPVEVEWLRTTRQVPEGAPEHVFEGALALADAFALCARGERAWVIERGARFCSVLSLRAAA